MTRVAYLWRKPPMRAFVPVLRPPAALLAVAIGLHGTAQAPNVGDPAPPFTLGTWLNVPAGKEPTLESLKDRVVMLEFWGTWCGPCVRAMPEVQKLHDRYGERGLTVLAISYEAPDAMQGFLQQNAYTMAVGSDPERKVVTAYGIRGWPSTYVIGKDGKIAHVGSPYDAEAAVERALGLETSPSTLLTVWLDAQATGKDQRDALTRLLEKAPPDFDLRTWARANGGAEAAVDAAGGAPAAQPADASAGGAGAAAVETVEGADLLRKVSASWSKNPDQRKPLLQQLGSGGPTAFDLGAFVREAYGRAFPLDQKELQTLLQQQKYADALAAIADRNPTAPVLAAAAKDKKLGDYCKKKLDDTRAMARKGIMVQRYVFANALPKDNDGFWKDLSVSGMATSPDKKQITGIILGGALVERAKIEGFVQGQLAQAILMDALKSGKPPQLKTLAKDVAKDRADIQKQLDARYGEPKPRKD